jgi:hypothetical protein
MNVLITVNLRQKKLKISLCDNDNDCKTPRDP